MYGAIAYCCVVSFGTYRFCEHLVSIRCVPSVTYSNAGEVVLARVDKRRTALSQEGRALRSKMLFCHAEMAVWCILIEVANHEGKSHFGAHCDYWSYMGMAVGSVEEDDTFTRYYSIDNEKFEVIILAVRPARPNIPCCLSVVSLKWLPSVLRKPCCNLVKKLDGVPDHLLWFPS